MMLFIFLIPIVFSYEPDLSYVINKQPINVYVSTGNTSYNSSYEYWNNDTLMSTYNVTYDSFLVGVTNPFDQWLNTTDNPTFNNMTSTGFFIGNGSLLTDIPVSSYNSSYEWYDNATIFIDTDTANTTDEIFAVCNNNSFMDINEPIYNSTYEWFLNTTIFSTFNTTYNALIGLVTNPFDQWLNITSNVVFNNVTAEWFNGNFNWTVTDDWNSFDGSTLDFNESKLSSVYFNATQSEIIAGTVDGGTLTDTQHSDGSYDGVTFNFSEASGSPALDLRINFTGVDDFNRGVMRFKTSDLAGDYPIVQMWNYDDEIWEDYPPVGESESFATMTQPVFDSSDHLFGDVAMMRIYKSSNGNTNNHYYVDWVAVIKGYGTPSGQEIDPYSIHRDGDVMLTGNWDVGGYNITGQGWIIANESLDNYNTSYDAQLGHNTTDEIFAVCNNDSFMDINEPIYNESYEWYDNTTIFSTYNESYLEAGYNPFDQWLNTTNDVTFSNVTTSGNISSSGYGIFKGTYNKSETLGYGNVRFGSYSGSTGWGTMTLETNYGDDKSLWTIDNGGSGIRIYETTPGADQWARFRITNTTITLGESYYGRTIDLNITGNTYSEGNITSDAIKLSDDKKQYFGDADEISMYYNGTDFLIESG